MKEPFITCSYCNRDVKYSAIKEHEFRCNDQPDAKAKIEKASEQSVRELLKDMIDRRSFFRDLVNNRLEVPPEEPGDADYGLAPHERGDDDGQ